MRLFALGLTLVTILRPALVYPSQDQPGALMLLAIDASRSMTIRDEFNNQTRWEALQAALQKCDKLLQNLRDERRINVVTVGFADRVLEDTRDLAPTGPVSDYGGMLAGLWERYGREPNLRGLIILGDGADNGRRYSALAEAQRFRGARCPIYAFATGQPIERDRSRDILIKEVSVEPSPAFIKGRMVIRAVIDAVGYENAPIQPQVRLDGRQRQ